MNADERIELVRELCSHEGRIAGTDAERRAANMLAGRLRDLGRAAEVEPTYVHPRYALVHASHCALGFAGSLIAIPSPAAGFAMVLVAALSMYLDLSGRLYLVRSLFFRRASQNVVSRGPQPDAAARLILCASYDTARGGSAFRPSRVARAARVAARSPLPLGPFRVLFWSLAVLLPLLGARMAGLDSGAVAALQLVPTLILLAGAFLLVDIELSDPVPGANDNGSGVAAAIALAAALDRERPAGLDAWVVLTAGKECLQEGMRAFVRSHRRELDPATTYFVCLEAVGSGGVRYEESAGWTVTYPMGRRLVELCEAVAEADREGDERYRAAPFRRGTAGDSLPPRIAGYEATTIACRDERGLTPRAHTAADTPDRLDPAALDGAHGFALALAGALARDAARRAEP